MKYLYSCLIASVLSGAAPADTRTVGHDGKTGSVNVETIHDSGDPSNRLDIVFVGEGYTEAELPAYRKLVQHLAEYILDFRPFDQYRNWINIHRVDVVSAESGIDNDAANGGVDVDTAMDMSFSESGKDLKADQSLVYAFANMAPGREAILVSVNSPTYSGNGNRTDVVLFSGGHQDPAAGLNSTARLVIHEMGHSLMQLADEYYSKGETYSGSEPPERNISIMNAQEMRASKAKWSHWLNESLSGIGMHDTYEGGKFKEFGVYRPSKYSLMSGPRWHDGKEYPLNGPGLEAAILQLHQAVNPIESVSHADIVVDAKAILRADILHPNVHQLEIQWKVNGGVVATGSPTLDLGAIDLPSGANLVELVVQDTSPLVRNERLRANFLTTRRTWVVNTGASPSGACCVADACIEISRAECVAQGGFWMSNLTCADSGCEFHHECMLVGKSQDGADNHLSPSLDIVGVSIRRLPRSLLEVRIELAGPLPPATDPVAIKHQYQIGIDTEAPFMTDIDWDDIDQKWEVIPLGGTYRGASNGMRDNVQIEGNTIVMWVDPSVLGVATKIAYCAMTFNNKGSVDTSAVAYGFLPPWEDLDDNGFPDHCEVPTAKLRGRGPRRR